MNDELEVGSSVGRYVVLRDAGGSKRAHLFVAWDPQLDRNIVLKLLTMRSDDRERIVHEAQALARLAHPNVVVVYDVGTTPSRPSGADGNDRVYVAMEYVEGDTLADWLKTERRSWTSIRDVIVQAGRGLAAAHAAEIVHLAVEPANIVVGSDGLVRVLEFGLAQRLRSPLSADSSSDPALDSGRMPAPTDGSPAYVAAERHRGELPDARADQFALCVTAWQAFYGRLPFDGDTRRDLRANIVRGRIVAPPASNVPAWIEAALRRGLDPDPTRRWPDLDALLAELQRDPRRTRKRVAMAMAVLAVLAAAGFAWMQRNDARATLCTGGEAKLAGIWDAPTREATRAAIAATHVSYADATWLAVEEMLDAYAVQWVAMYTDACEATRLRGEQSESLLDRRMSCLEQRRHELQALVRVYAEADPSVVERAVSAADGLDSLEPCADVERLMADAPPLDPSQRSRREELTRLLAQARALDRAGRLDESEAAAEQALAIAIELDAKPEAASCHLTLGTVAEGKGDVDAALRHANEAVWLSERAAADAQRLDAITQLAWTIGHLKADYASGHSLVRLGLGIADRIGTDTVHRVRLLSHEAALYIDEGKHREAIELGLRAAKQLEQLDGDHAELAVIYNNVGAAQHLIGEADRALHQYELARDVRVRMLGASHPDVAEVVANAAMVKHSLGRLDEAEADFRRAIEVLDEGPRSRGVFMRNLHNNFAIVLQDLGQYDEAITSYRRGIDGWRAADPKHPLIGVGLSNIADLELERGRPAEAEKLAAEALAVLEGGLDADHRYVAYASATLGRAKLASGHADDALPLLRRGLAILGGSDADAHAIAQTQLALAEALVATRGDLGEALTLAIAADRRLAELPHADLRAAAKELIAKLRGSGRP